MLILKRLKWYPLNFSIAYLSEQKSGGPSELHVAGRVVRKELYVWVHPSISWAVHRWGRAFFSFGCKLILRSILWS